MEIFLTSVFGGGKKIDGVWQPTVIDDKNGLLSQLKEGVKCRKNFVYVASNPKGFEKTDKMASLAHESFKMSGIEFENMFVLDDRTKEKAKELVESADFIMLTGGRVPTQNAFLQEMNFAEILKGYKGVILGQSAGSMNMAKKVYNYPEDADELDDPKYLEGLGLTKISILPHFDLNCSVEGVGLMTDFFKKDSINHPLIALIDGSHIRIKCRTAEIFGEAYLFEGGEMSRVCEKEKTCKVSDLILCK